jgi:ribosomal protein S18 acetylase RimI-like enzyme
MALAFRYATAEDARAIHGLIQAAFAEYAESVPVTPGAVLETPEDARQAASETRVLLAFEADGTLVGTARHALVEDALWIGRVAVHPGYRRRGIGRAIMLEMERVARRLGCARLRLSTRDSMPGNLSFYKELGYHIVGSEPHPRGPDVIVHFEKGLAGGGG